ncbi:putative T-SNARE affecting a late Golgi compartment protein 2 [Glarea lozoyensis 74030]|uniref:Putative t-SNARE affecting a late Golgi compartment protein 2 n=1 Tax=Glarea lozoyensis (strain ATCC 74030 / MF5533) TaxID=1104152 RepID=H0EGH3_GLAL7|nr:putative T-SNARE affecting a late Golgi compartment protein 2 [Glarea lozoyensis 74030]
MESDADKSYSESALQMTAQKQLTSNDAAIMQREREIMDIAQGIIELADIFKELQSMIIDQGTMLDRIDYNVERMATDVKAADKDHLDILHEYIGHELLAGLLIRRGIPDVQVIMV